MSHRFFVDTPITGDQAQLLGSEQQHLAQVMRARVGDTITLFDGSGAEYTARVTSIRRSGVDLEVLARQQVDREPGVHITLGVALPKGERQRWLVEKAVELGVSCIVPLVTDRGVARPVQRAISRLERHVVEASKQCGRNRLMQIVEPTSAMAYLAPTRPDALCLLAHITESARPVAEVAESNTATEVYLAVGPEGGFSDREIESADQWQMTSLGPRTLRVETAALAMVSYFSLRDARGIGG